MTIRPVTSIALAALALASTAALVPTAAARDPICVSGGDDSCIIRWVVCVTDPCPPRIGTPDRCVYGWSRDCLVQEAYCTESPCLPRVNLPLP